MQKFIKWTLGSLLVCSGVFATSHTDSVTNWVESGPLLQQQTTQQQVTKQSAVSPVILRLEQKVKMTRFDQSSTIHSLRFKRIVFYLSEARNYDAKRWDYNRDEALTRAANILRHHQARIGQGYEI